jgi:hypothetical protein
MFPLRAGVVSRAEETVDSFEEETLPHEQAQFYGNLGRFLDKWQLIGLATWDLPEPQGPLEDFPLGLAAQLLGPDHTTTIYPTYFDIPSSDDVRGRIREEQRRVARRAGIESEHPVTNISARREKPSTNISARRENPSTYESAFRMWLVEKTIRSRYGELSGVVSRLKVVFSELHGFNQSRAAKIRALYLNYL